MKIPFSRSHREKRQSTYGFAAARQGLADAWCISKEMSERKHFALRFARRREEAGPRARTITFALICISCGDRIAQALADCGSLRCHDCRDQSVGARGSLGRLTS